MGRWEFVENPGCELPEKVATAFAGVFEGMEGASYKPVLYCGSQIVNGMNYMLICEQKLVTEISEIHYTKVILHVTLDDDWSILSIETIA